MVKRKIDRSKERLLAREVERLAAERPEKTRMHHDGGGLYLCVDKRRKSVSWAFRYTLGGKSRTMGLGEYPAIGLSKARERAKAARALKAEGLDPLEKRDAERAAKRIAAAQAMTFKQCAQRYIAAHSPSWKNAKHIAQWPSSMERYVYPFIGDLPVAAIDTRLVTKILEPHWTTKNETMTRVRQRLEAVLDWAKAREYRSGDNPAAWRGHLEKLLPDPTQVHQAKRHAALPVADVVDFMKALRAQGGTAARGLEFLILTAVRTSEVLGAAWSEVDFDRKVWTVPAERMKGRKGKAREHRVPLSPGAVAILNALKPDHPAPGAYIFQGGLKGKPLSNMAFLMLLRRMERSDLTAHGFRSTFRDWIGDHTEFQREIGEAALAHAVGDQTERAYRRGDALEKRRIVMDAWQVFCSGVPAGECGALHPADGA